MDFFRKYQRPILLVAAVFALITFSITGDMLSTFEGLFRDRPPAATIKIGGKETELTVEDRQVARALKSGTGLVAVMPGLPSVDPTENQDPAERIAVIRRAAITSGIEASYDEVDEAIEAVAATRELDVRDLARGFASFDQFRATVYEGIRVGTYVRLNALPLAPLDHELAQSLASEQDLVTLRYLKIDKKAIEEGLEAELDAKEDSDTELQTWLTEWLDDLGENDRQRMPFVDPDRLRLEVYAIDTSAFDPEQWSAELEGVEAPTDAEIEQFYASNKTTMFELDASDPATGNGDKDEGDKDEGDKDEGDKDEGDKDKGDEKEDVDKGDEDDPKKDDTDPQDGTDDGPKYRELDDALRAEIRNRLLAKAALENVWSKVELALYERLSPLIDARTAALVALSEARTARDEAKEAAAADESDSDLQAALEAAEQALEAAESAHEAADDAVAARRTSFDAAAAFPASVAGRAGVSMQVLPDEAVPAADLRELGSFGTWFRHNDAARVNYAGQMSTAVTDTASHVLAFRVAELVDAPLKAFEDVADVAREKYLSTKADELAEARQEQLEEVLERLGRAARVDEIQTIQDNKASKLETQVEEWRTELQNQLADAEQRLQSVGNNQRARKALEARIISVREELATEETQRQEFSDELDLEVEIEIDEAILSAYAEILDEVAAEVGLPVGTLGPARRVQISRGVSTEEIDPDVYFYYFQSRLKGLEVGDTTGVQQNRTDRTVLLAVVTEVKEADTGSFPRRDFLEYANRNRDSRAREALAQSFSTEALEKRLGYRPPGEEAVPQKK